MFVQQVAAVGDATVRDAVRRPAFGVGALALGALLAVLPRLTNPAAGIADNARLALELSASTVLVATSGTAALFAVRGSLADQDAGCSAELRALPAPADAIAAGRWLGAVGAAMLLGVIATAVGAVGWIGRPLPAALGDAGRLALVVAGWFGAVSLGAGLGSLYGSRLSRELAVMAVLAHFVAARWISCLEAPGAAWIRAVFPDPARADLAREFAFQMPVFAGATLLGVLACGTQTAAALAMSAGAVRFRR